MSGYIKVFDFEISTYCICFLFGVIAGLILALCIKKFFKVSVLDTIGLYLYELVGLFIGSKLLYALENSSFSFFQTFLSGGFLFIGGILGGILGIYIYSRQYKLSFEKNLSSIIITFPAIYSFAKIGCFFAGCCYGIPYNGIRLLPIQLIDSFSSFIICAMLFILIKMNFQNKLAGLYFIFFSIARFSSDFFRGKIVKTIFDLSLTQLVCIILFIAGVLLITRANRDASYLTPSPSEQKQPQGL